MKLITGHQPVYLPWLGLFHKIALADAFVFMDDVQYLDKDWNNRNRIKGPQGPFWLTVPVRLKASATRLLKDIRIADDGWNSKNHWQKNHWKSIQSCYTRAPYWDNYAPFFEKLYTEHPWQWLSELNLVVLSHLLEIFDIRVDFHIASEIGFSGSKSDLVLDHCRKLQADICVLGMHGKDYLIERDFFQAGVFVHYQNYRHPQYPQRFGQFEPNLSVLDLLFNCGPESRDILLGGNMTKAALVRLAGQSSGPCVLGESTDQ